MAQMTIYVPDSEVKRWKLAAKQIKKEGGTVSALVVPVVLARAPLPEKKEEKTVDKV